MHAEVLVIEDDADIRELVTHHLERSGFRVRSAATAAEGWARFTERMPDIVVLDLLLPDGHGFDLCRRFRETDRGVGIVMLTALSEETDQVAGLELGADDYVVKPFRPRELVARVRAVLRRTAVAGGGGAARVGRLAIDPVRMVATVDGQPIPLTAMEFKLLYTLAERPGAVWTRRQLLDRVWGEEFVGDERTVDVHIRHIRAKLEPFDAAGMLDTVRGVGYRLKGDAP